MAPPTLKALLQPDPIEGKYRSIELLKADPTSTVEDLYDFGHQAEATVRRANRDQIDSATLLQREQIVECSWWQRITRRCP